MRRFLSALAFPAFGLAAWWLVVDARLVSRLYLPAPAEVLGAAREAGPGLAGHALATLLRLLGGFSLGFVVGYAIGIALVMFPTARALFSTALDSSRPAPMVATLPFFLLWFGFAWYGQVAFIALGVALIVASGVLDASRAVPPGLIRVAQSFRASRWQVARSVIMPGLLPQLVPTLRVCLGIAGSLTVASEFMGAETGLGQLLELSRRTLRTENLVLYTFVLGFIVVSCDLALRAYLAFCLRWMPAAQEALDVRPDLRKEKINAY